MRVQHEIKTVFTTLKGHLRERGLTYKDVAKSAHMSESNLKRILATETCSVDRLAEICEAAETTIFDLILAASKSKTPVFEVNEEAQDFFVENFECFVFFRRLAASADPNSMVKASKLPKDKLSFYLKNIEKFGFISQRAGKIHVLAKGYIYIPDGSELACKVEELWIPWLFNKIMTRREDPQHFLKISSTGLTEAHRLQLHQEVNDLLEKYKEIGFVDQKIGTKKVEPVGICIGIAPHRVGFFDDTPSILK